MKHPPNAATEKELGILCWLPPTSLYFTRLSLICRKSKSNQMGAKVRAFTKATENKRGTGYRRPK